MKASLRVYLRQDVIHERTDRISMRSRNETHSGRGIIASERKLTSGRHGLVMIGHFHLYESYGMPHPCLILVAFFLVDAMRYEMGRDLGTTLEAFGSVTVAAAATVLPTSTPCGMAALMPGADGAYTLVQDGADVSPSVGGRILRGSADRMRVFGYTSRKNSTGDSSGFWKEESGRSSISSTGQTKRAPKEARFTFPN